jgi:hypothetical protein
LSSASDDADVTRVVAALAGRDPADVTIDRIGGGGNSRVWRVDCADGARFAAKCYLRLPGDERERMKVEFGSLEFLWRSGVRSIPEPIAADPAHECGLFEFVDGTKPAPGDVSAADIDAAVGFLGRLAELAAAPGAHDLPDASASCFSAAAIARDIERRIARLEALPAGGAGGLALHAYLDEELRPAADGLLAWSRARLAAAGVSFDEEIVRAERTLSPSDFGFHNAIRRPTGEIVFIDFEYFGWDDPAKMIADFLLHPGTDLPHDLGRRFVRGILDRFGGQARLPDRVEGIYPLIGLTWCLIMLNEFLPDQWLRREFAMVKSRDRTARQGEQLSKSRRMLQRMKDEHERFPYRD